jgi:hypothetical protein
MPLSVAIMTIKPFASNEIEFLDAIQILMTHVNFNFLMCSSVGWDSAVSIATRYGLDSPGIEYQWG